MCFDRCLRVHTRFVGHPCRRAPRKKQEDDVPGEEEGDGTTSVPVGADGKPVKLSGSLFFALPDGGAVLYQLEGEAEGPEPASTTELETPAKTALAFTLPVTNWLRRAQRRGTARGGAAEG